MTDYFVAVMEDGQLVLEPYCACGQHLSEKYYCDTCRRQCRPAEFRCRDEDTLAYVQKTVLANPGFSRFQAVLAQPAADRDVP